MRPEQGHQPKGGNLDMNDPPIEFTAIRMPAQEWLDAYLAKMHDLVALDNYCFERHAVMGIEMRKMKNDLWCVLDNGEPLVIVRILDSALAEGICRLAVSVLKGEEDQTK